MEEEKRGREKMGGGRQGEKIGGKREECRGQRDIKNGEEKKGRR